MVASRQAWVSPFAQPAWEPGEERVVEGEPSAQHGAWSTTEMRISIACIWLMVVTYVVSRHVWEARHGRRGRRGVSTGFRGLMATETQAIVEARGGVAFFSGTRRNRIFGLTHLLRGVKLEDIQDSLGVASSLFLRDCRLGEQFRPLRGKSLTCVSTNAAYDNAL